MAVYESFNDEFLKNIIGVSYIGKPKNHTAMYMSKKIENKIFGLKDCVDCLVFIENTVNVPEELKEKHIFILCKDPAASYTIVVSALAEKIEKELRAKKYTLTEGGYYIGEDVELGENVYIEPTALIDHGVKIGNNVTIKSGAKIRYGTVIGNDCSIGENTVIGEPGYNIAEIADGKSVIVPNFGGVLIGDNVYIGSQVAISKGTADNTVMGDNVKIDSLVRLGHDVILKSKVEIRASSIIAGYVEIGEKTVVGAGAMLKNRIIIGKDSYLGMACYQNHDLRDGMIVTGNPAVSLEKFGEHRALMAELKSLVKNKT